MRYVIVDLEATCWEKGTRPGRMEIIEIGAVILPSASGEATSEFGEFVCPVMRPILSEFCIKLTGIQQNDIEGAGTFPDVFPRFIEWIGPEQYVLCSWGAYDLRQFQTDCRRHQLTFPQEFKQHLNMKRLFAEQEGIKPCTMKEALWRLKIPLTGKHHRAIDDALNIAKIARIILPRMEEKG
jgi:3'-5' exoribonuclease 1